MPGDQVPAGEPESGAREQFVRSGSARLYVRDLGHGLPIVVVHGGPDFDHEYFVPELDRLAEQFHLVYYDQRGRGRSFTGGRPSDVTIASEIDDLDRVREHFGSESVAVLGHSWGCVLAMEYAIRRPDRVSHLILLNTAPASHAGVLALRRALAARRSPEQIDRMAAIASDPAYQAGDISAEAEYYRIHFGAGLADPQLLDRVIPRLRRAFTPEGIVAARAIERALYEQTWRRAEYDLLPQLRQLRVPALVIHGDADLIPAQVARDIAAAIPGSSYIELASCGHFSYLEQPDRVRTSIAEFLTRPVR